MFRLPLGSCQKPDREEHQGNSKNARKGLQTIPAHSRPRHGVMGFHLNRSCYIKPTSIYQFKSNRSVNSDAYGQVKIL